MARLNVVNRTTSPNKLNGRDIGSGQTACNLCSWKGSSFKVMCRCSNEYEYCNECIDRCVPKRQEREPMAWVSATMIDGEPVDLSKASGSTALPDPKTTAGDPLPIPGVGTEQGKVPQYVQCVCGYYEAGKTQAYLHAFDCSLLFPKCAERRRESDEIQNMQRLMNLQQNAPLVPKAEDTRSPKENDSFHKVPVDMFPPTAIIAGAITLCQGHKKPGRTKYNWRNKEEAIKLTQYLAACQRHIICYLDGEDFDTELTELAGQNISHLWAAFTNLAMIIDAQETGTCMDDRNKKGVAAEMLRRLTPALKPNT